MSVGLTLIFGVLRIPNFAHGEFLMLGMYVTYWFVVFTHLNPVFSIAVSAAVLFVLGYFFQSQLLSRVSRQGEVPQIFLTVALSIFLSNAAEILWGSNYRIVPVSYTSTTFHIGLVSVYAPNAIIFAFSLFLAGLLWFLLNKTHTGLAIQATAQDPEAAQLMGTDIKKVTAVSFALGAALAAVAGSLLAPLYPIFPTVGSYFILLMFTIVVLGGLGDVKGAFVGGTLISVVLSVSSIFVTEDLGFALVFIMFILILVLAPQGLFGKTVK
ncbi:MAG: branched-chain amino acid ABC transporter permease [Nitrososphaerota archaeon]|nr:branched-chain amino acid ABC transporter permease [Nitrososphaerota archaeon]